MAYAESTVGGSSAGPYRVWVNSIRTYDGGPSENFEDWRVEGGLNKISTGGYAYNNYGNSSYTVQLGLNGVASSGNFSYNFASGTTGTVLAWGTGSTRVYRSSAGVGFGFQSRMDINLQNSPYLTSGWVTSNDSVQTKYRHASLTALSMDAGGIPATDEGPLWLEFTNPAGASVDAFIEAPSPSFPRIYTSAGGRTSRFNFPNLSGGSLTTALQQATPNSNTATLRIGIHDSLGGDSWDYRDRTYTIKNDAGQANPVFSNFTFADTNSATVAVTGSNQVLIQGKSTLSVTVPVADKAVPQKYATMSSYTFGVGGYSQSAAFSSGSNVVQAVGTVSDVTGAQNISVRAVDSRGNSTTVTKPTTILPYSGPGFFYALNVKYANEFDNSSGLTVEGYDTNGMALISPLTLSGTDKNSVATTYTTSPAPSGVRFQLSRGSDPWDGVWTSVTISQDAGTGIIRMTPATLATAINNRMNTIGADNTQPWYVWFQISDKLETHDYILVIDIGRPIMRIGADSHLYHKEIEFSTAFNPTTHMFSNSALFFAGAGGGTWGHEAIAGSPASAMAFTNSATKANGNYLVVEQFLSPGVYTMYMWAVRASDAPLITVYQNGTSIFTATSGNAFDLYNASTIASYRPSLSGITITEPGVYQFAIQANGKNASSTSYYLRVFGLYFYKTGYLA